jgi:hypothetical protein
MISRFQEDPEAIVQSVAQANSEDEGWYSLSISNRIKGGNIDSSQISGLPQNLFYVAVTVSQVLIRIGQWLNSAFPR